VPLLTIVIVSNVRFILIGSEVPLVGIYIYRSIVVPKSYTNVILSPFIVRTGHRESSYPSLPLLLVYKLSIVDIDCYSDILIEGIRSVYLI
jgi:hypothetical protein